MEDAIADVDVVEDDDPKATAREGRSAAQPCDTGAGDVSLPQAAGS